MCKCIDDKIVKIGAIELRNAGADIDIISSGFENMKRVGEVKVLTNKLRIIISVGKKKKKDKIIESNVMPEYCCFCGQKINLNSTDNNGK